MMRVLILSSAFHPAIGGAETYAQNLRRGLAGRGADVAVFTDMPREMSLPTDPMREIVRAKEYQSLLDAHDKVRWEQLYFSLLPELDAAVRQFSPNILHANSHETAFLASFAGQEYGFPVVATFHEQSPERSPLGKGRCKLVYSHLPINQVVAGSHFYMEKAQQFGIHAERLKLIRHGIDPSIFCPDLSGSLQRSRWEISSESLVILCAARISPRKGQLDLVRAFRGMHRDIPHAKLVLAGTYHSGSTEYLRAVRSCISEGEIADKVVIDASLKLDAMPAAYAAADIVVQPSYEEGLGLALLEAMSTQRCVIGTNVVGIREVITHPSVGVLVPLGDIDRLSQALRWAAVHPDERSRLGRAARTHVIQNFHVQSMIGQTIELYESLLK